MAKASSPIRLEEHLMHSATLAAAQEKRSTAEQVEYWASVGRIVSRYVNSATLTQVIAGSVALKTEPVAVPSIDPDALFDALEEKRANNTLGDAIPHTGLRYQASAHHPGMLEQVSADGTITVGQFHNGTFTPLSS